MSNPPKRSLVLGPLLVGAGGGMIKTISESAKAEPTGKNMKGVLLCITTTKWKHSIFIFYLTGNFLFLTTPMLANKKSLSVVYT